MSRIWRMTDKQVPSYPLRMPVELREKLTLVAKNNNRSVNAEIIARLESSLDATGAKADFGQDVAVRSAMAASLADVAVLTLTQDKSWKEDVARRVAESLRAMPLVSAETAPVDAQPPKNRQRPRKA